MCEHARGADTVRDGRFSHAILGAPPCSEMKPHATRLIAGSLQQRLLGVAGGLTCGCKRWQKVLCGSHKERCQAVRLFFRSLFYLYLEWLHTPTHDRTKVSRTHASRVGRSSPPSESTSGPHPSVPTPQNSRCVCDCVMAVYSYISYDVCATRPNEQYSVLVHFPEI